MGDVSLKLVIRGPNAATKMQGLQVKLTIAAPRSFSGEVTWTLKDVISNDMISPKPGSASHVSGNGETTNNYTLGDIFDTPKTGAYLVRAHLNGVASNELSIKMLL